MSHARTPVLESPNTRRAVNVFLECRPWETRAHSATIDTNGTPDPTEFGAFSGCAFGKHTALRCGQRRPKGGMCGRFVIT